MKLVLLTICLLSSWTLAAVLERRINDRIYQVPQRSALAVARVFSKIWGSTKPDKYQYKFLYQCGEGCPPEFAGPWLIKVDGGVSTAELVVPQIDDFSDTIIADFGTIDKLYKQAISQLKDGVFTVSLEVDIKEFIITSFSVDVIEYAVDDEYFFSVSEYKEL